MKASSIFLIRMLTVFLDLTEPASRKAKPHCMKKMTIDITIKKNWSASWAISPVLFSESFSLFKTDSNCSSILIVVFV